MKKDEHLASPFSPDYLRGFDQGQKHAIPSPETIRRLDEIETKVDPLPLFMQHVTEVLSSIKEDTAYTNGKVADLVSWREQIKGAKQALGVIWMVLGVFATAGIFALFSMWSQLQHLNALLK
jgi:hypothetical protein